MPINNSARTPNKNVQPNKHSDSERVQTPEPLPERRTPFSEHRTAFCDSPDLYCNAIIILPTVQRGFEPKEPSNKERRGSRPKKPKERGRPLPCRVPPLFGSPRRLCAGALHDLRNGCFHTDKSRVSHNQEPFNRPGPPSKRLNHGTWFRWP